MPNSATIDLVHLRRLRAAALLEGATLLMLVGIAVPLKHIAGMPVAVSVMGPIHGMVFLAYLWMIFGSVSSPSLTGRDIRRLLLASLVPFGAAFSIALLNRKAAALGHQVLMSARGDAS